MDHEIRTQGPSDSMRSFPLSDLTRYTNYDAFIFHTVRDTRGKCRTLKYRSQ